jgi:hypothetical protein
MCLIIHVCLMKIICCAVKRLTQRVLTAWPGRIPARQSVDVNTRRGQAINALLV